MIKTQQDEWNKRCKNCIKWLYMCFKCRFLRTKCRFVFFCISRIVFGTSCTLPFLHISKCAIFLYRYSEARKFKNPDDPRIVISNWLSSYSTIDFLSTRESLYNPNFNRMEFHTVRNHQSNLRTHLLFLSIHNKFIKIRFI